MERRELPPVAGGGVLGEPIVGVVGGDASLRGLVTATLQLGGAAHVVPATDRAWVQSELADGRLQRVVLLGGPPPTDFAAADHARVVWYQLEPGSACPPGVTSLAWPAPLDDLVAATLGVAPRTRPPTWSTQAFGVVAPRLVGLLAALRPSLRIIFSGDAGAARNSEGRPLSIGREPARPVGRIAGRSEGTMSVFGMKRVEFLVRETRVRSGGAWRGVLERTCKRTAATAHDGCGFRR